MPLDWTNAGQNLPRVMRTVTHERRKVLRQAFPPRLAIQLLQPPTSVVVDRLNISPGGLCLRLEEALEVRSLIQFQVSPEASATVIASSGVRFPLHCLGRVAWVTQRLDLRGAPPFLFDIGIEFIDPSPMLQRLVARLNPDSVDQPSKTVLEKALESLLIGGRRFVPRLQRETTRPPRWHLVVSVDGAPCLSAHYPSERAALAAWAQFKRRQTRR